MADLAAVRLHNRAGEVRTVDQLTTPFDLCLVVVDGERPRRLYQLEPVIDRLDRTLGDADCTLGVLAGPGPLGLLATALLAPLGATILQLAVSRSREYEADAAGARLLGDGRPLAKLDRAARTVPMDVDPAQAAKYIVSPLTGRHVSSASLFSTHPPIPGRIARLGAGGWPRG